MNRADANRLARSALGDPMLDYKGVAAHLGVGLSTVRRWVSEGRLTPDFTLGGIVRFRPATVEQIIAQHTTARADSWN